MKTVFPSNCKHCGSQNLEIRAGRGPHALAVECADCNRWIKWISKGDAVASDLEVNRG